MSRSDRDGLQSQGKDTLAGKSHFQTGREIPRSESVSSLPAHIAGRIYA